MTRSIGNLRNTNSTETESTSVTVRAGGWPGSGGGSSCGAVSFGGDENVVKSAEIVVTQLCEIPKPTETDVYFKGGNCI